MNIYLQQYLVVLGFAAFVLVSAKPTANAKPEANADAEPDYESTSDYLRLLNLNSAGHIYDPTHEVRKNLYLRKGAASALRSIAGYGVPAHFRGAFGDYFSPSGFKSLNAVANAQYSSHHAAQAAHAANVAAQAAHAAKIRGIAANAALANQADTLNNYYNTPIYRQW